MRGTDVERAPLFMNFLISLAPLRSSKSEEEEEFFQDAYPRIKISVPKFSCLFRYSSVHEGSRWASRRF